MTQFLVEQAGAVVRQRQKNYNHPWINFNDIALAWSGILHIRIKASQVALMMIQMKTYRQNFKHQDDNLVDIGGYTICLEQIEAIEAKIAAGDLSWKDDVFGKDYDGPDLSDLYNTDNLFFDARFLQVETQKAQEWTLQNPMPTPLIKPGVMYANLREDSEAPSTFINNVTHDLLHIYGIDITDKLSDNQYFDYKRAWNLE